jgi:peptidoglycan/LPS O-acetylase OafA/YrhL
MTICKHCGVEIAEGTDPCPLCQLPQKDSLRQNQSSNPYLGDDSPPLTSREKIRLFWEISGILHFSALVVTVLIDIITNKQPSWSLYVVTCLTASFLYITLLCFTVRKLWIFLPGLFLNTLGFIVLIDLYKHGINWFINPGLPLTGFFVLLLGLVLYFAYKTRDKGFNIIAAAAVAVGVYCVIIEVFVAMALNEPVSPSWSVIVAASILPFSLLLFFFHYRLKRGRNLKKFFHL